MIPAVLLLASSQNPTVQGFQVYRLESATSRMSQFVRDQEVAGVVGLVQRNGIEVSFTAHGYASLDPKKLMKKDSIFQIMSMTKPVTAVAVMICAERGLLNLDDPVSRYLPSFGKLNVKQVDGTTKPANRAITIRHLLTHTSGLSSSDPGGLDDDTKSKMTLADYASRYGSDSLESEPGTQIRYSGPGITAAGRIVEIVSKRKFDDFLQAEVFERLKMSDTVFFAPESFRSRIAQMTWLEEGKWRSIDVDPMRPGSKFANPAGGLYSTASDMAKFMTCIVNGGANILSKRSVHAMTTLQTGDLLSDGNDIQGYGLGFSVIRHTAGSPTLRPAGSFGHTGAFNTEMWADPKTKTVVVFMSQTWNERPRKTFTTMINAAFVGP
ncbi:MAG: beta-lactamase family protein [Chthonomonas sp.]|nr:beta-lactamase family protein [Chthonomonas sp.]